MKFIHRLIVALFQAYMSRFGWRYVPSPKPSYKDFQDPHGATLYTWPK